MKYGDWCVNAERAHTPTSHHYIGFSPVSPQCERGKRGGDGQAAVKLPRGEEGKLISPKCYSPGPGDSQGAAPL